MPNFLRKSHTLCSTFYNLKTFHTDCTLHRKIWHSAGNKGLGHKADTTWQITKSFITVMATNLLNFIFTPPIQTYRSLFWPFEEYECEKLVTFLGNFELKSYPVSGFGERERGRKWFAAIKWEMATSNNFHWSQYVSSVTGTGGGDDEEWKLGGERELGMSWEQREIK